MTDPRPVPLEHAEQVAVFQWAAAKVVAYPDLKWLYAVPNQGGNDRSAMIRGAKMKAEGLKSGYPDIGLDVARGGWFGLRIEMKRRKKSVVSEEQEAWHRRLWAQGYKVVVARGWEEAAAALTEYLGLPATRVVTTAVA